MDEKLDLVKKSLLSYPDFPKKGVIFKDLFSVFANFEAFQALIELLKSKAAEYKGKIDYVVGLDARGFLFGPIMALEAGVPFIPIRKAGKLPGDTAQTSYDLEYGSATVEIQKDAMKIGGGRVLIVDDLLATGGTMKAACDLVKAVNCTVAACFVIIELTFLKGREKLPEGTVLDALIPED